MDRKFINTSNSYRKKIEVYIKVNNKLKAIIKVKTVEIYQELVTRVSKPLTSIAIWVNLFPFLCQLTCQSADIMSSLCGVGVRVRVNNFSSKTTRPRDVLFFLKDTLSIEDEKLFKACKSVCSSVC